MTGRFWADVSSLRQTLYGIDYRGRGLGEEVSAGFTVVGMARGWLLEGLALANVLADVGLAGACGEGWLGSGFADTVEDVPTCERETAVNPGPAEDGAGSEAF